MLKSCMHGARIDPVCYTKLTNSAETYMATEKLLRTRFGIRSPNSMLELAKHNAKELDALRRRLALAGFYDDLPLDLRLTSDQCRLICSRWPEGD